MVEQSDAEQIGALLEPVGEHTILFAGRHITREVIVLCDVTSYVESSGSEGEKRWTCGRAERLRPSRTAHNYSFESQARMPGSFCQEGRAVADRGSHWSVACRTLRFMSRSNSTYPCVVSMDA